MRIQIGLQCKIATNGPQVPGRGSILEMRSAGTDLNTHDVNKFIAWNIHIQIGIQCKFASRPQILVKVQLQEAS